ncbi:MAG: ubiquinol-cytochrome c reductase cytochrome b subunit [Acidimicrobiia bacterium]
MIRKAFEALDRRLGLAKALRGPLRKVFPSHWSFLLGEIALYSFVMLVLTGLYLTFFFEPSSQEVLYQGAFAPLRGVEMSRAYASALDISFGVKAGLVMRQIHHWSALVFLAAIVCHLGRIFFTGAFRKPREINWVIGVTMLILAIANGFLGYSLIDDLLSGTGLRIAYSVVISIPFIGTRFAHLLFGGPFPAPETIPRFYSLHILVIPILLAVFLTAHLAIVWYQKHTQFPGKGRTELNVVGSRLWPTYAAKSIGFFFLVAASLSALGGLVQINPIWIYGPFDPAAVSSPAQPDWYMGWLEGALRIFPSWNVHLGHYLIPEIFVPAVVLPSVTFLVLYLWPFLEAWVSGDHREHHLLDRPSEHPLRTAIGVAGISFYGTLLIAGSDDVLSLVTDANITNLVWVFRVLVLTLPLIAGWVAYLILRKPAEATDIEERAASVPLSAD